MEPVSRRSVIVLVALLPLALTLGLGQASVTGIVATGSGEKVRHATVIFEERDDPTRSSTASTDSNGLFVLTLALTDVPRAPEVPSSIALAQNYPNPFSSSTTIGYALQRQVETRLTVFDVLGRIVRDSRLGDQSAGPHAVLWDGADVMGRRVAPGVYFYRLQAGGESRVRKMIVERGSAPGGAATVLPPAVSRVASPVGILRSRMSMSYTVRIVNTASTSPQIYGAVQEGVVLEGDTALFFHVTAQPPAPVATVFSDSVQQVIRGFGGANILPWRPAMTASECATAFGAGPGQVGFTILRLRIPSSTDQNEFAAQAHVATLAQAAGAQIIVGSPWSPPPAMKTNNDLVAGSLNDTSYGSFAVHLKGFADFMASQGVPLYALSLQNEPDARVTYESCDWTAVQFRTFLKTHAGSIGHRIIMPESQNFVRALSDSSLNDPAAAANIAIIGGHIYGGGLGTYPLAVSKGKEIWMTEHLDLDTSWSGAFGTGREIHDCLSSGWSAYIWWYIVRYYGPIGEDGTMTKRGYVMSQYSRFIRPGYRKVACTTTPQRNVTLSAYRDPVSGRTVIVILNSGSSALAQGIAVTSATMQSFAVYTTTKVRNCERGPDIPVSTGACTVTLEPSSITTMVSP